MSRKHKEIEGLVKAAIDEKVDLNAIINDGLIEAMDIVGKKFGSGEIFVPEMLVSAITMKEGLAIIKPLLQGDASQPKGLSSWAQSKAMFTISEKTWSS